VFLGYDTKFIFTEVNGDKLIWLVRGATGDEKFTIIAVETGSIGKNISTKAVGQDRRHDITYQYKYPEGRCTAQVRRCLADVLGFVGCAVPARVPGSAVGVLKRPKAMCR
jgi:hypothetical protein